ncbi:GDSL-type esterase/lipase family protein [Flavonifractor hominis]|uniref:GDSL-type esterase/lipase family protein n=1 Tax=Flavonifractor hominis TaxID=3133178 RepID=A0ABV1ESZ7_9FIRM
MSSPRYQPKRRRHRRSRTWKLPLLVAALAVCLGLLFIPSLGRAPDGSEPASADVSPSATPVLTPEPTPTLTPEPTPEITPEPTPEAADVFDFTQPAPASEKVDMDYFSDALFIGDSRTDGLRLYSGIKGADFYCYKGLTIFEMDNRKVVELNGTKYTVVEALEKGPQYAKIYISLGINELGYFNDDAFHNTFGEFLAQVKALQPNAIIYLENLVPVNAEQCAANNQPSYVNNDRVADYNAIFPQLAQEYQVVLLDVADALTDENGILPADATVDGVHFTKTWYENWLAFLMEHTVDPDAYAAGQAAAEGVNET